MERDDTPGATPGGGPVQPGAGGSGDFGRGPGDEIRITPAGGQEGTPPAPTLRRQDTEWHDKEEEAARARRDPGAIRAEDTEPYIGLQYHARLFKIVAMVVIVALTAEVVIGVSTEGSAALIPLFAEVIQGGVLAAILWGASDLTLLLIDLGHDVRAARVLLGRMSARAELDAGPQRRQRSRERE